MPFIGTTPVQGFVSSVNKQSFTANGSTTSFTLTHPVSNANDLEVFVGNVRQEPTAAYTASGTLLDFGSGNAPPSGVNLYVIYKNLAQVTTTVADGSVGTGKIADNAVTVGKLATSGTLPALNGSALTNIPSIGVGQTWTDVTSSRSVGTVYTNSTGKPIFCVFIGTTGTSAGCNWEIGGVAGPQQTYTNSSNGRSEISAIVPNGVTYEVNGNATKQTWIELR